MNISKILFLNLLLMHFVLAGCTEPDSPQPDPQPKVEIDLNPTTLDFDATGGQQSIQITSNTLWRISFDGIAWCRPTIQSGNGDANVTITTDPNPEESIRSATFIVSATGAENITLTINQEAKEPDEPDPGFVDYIEPDNTGMRNITSLEFANLITVGWNLGNSLEAISVNNGIYSGGETTWGNPVVSKQLIDSVKAAGFDFIRLPVSWSHKLENNQTWKISSDWLQRVEEVVNYALDNDMFVKINIHWDGDWMNQPVYSQQDTINQKLTALWQQIAVHFRDYDDRLLFAGTNEVHVSGNYGAPTNENAAVQNSFNQTFVDAVRSTGGRNSYRFLAVQSYNTNIDHAVNHFVMPTDTISDKLLAEVHFYDPYQFALMETGDFNTLWGQQFAGGDVSNWGQEAWVDAAFDKVKTLWVDKGTGVIIGEYGALLRTNLVGQALEDHIEARNYYLNYVTAAAKQRTIVPVYWDNGHTGHNGFGLFNRQNGEQTHADAIEAIITGAE